MILFKSKDMQASSIFQTLVEEIVMHFDVLSHFLLRPFNCTVKCFPRIPPVSFRYISWYRSCQGKAEKCTSRCSFYIRIYKMKMGISKETHCIYYRPSNLRFDPLHILYDCLHMTCQTKTKVTQIMRLWRWLSQNEIS